MFDSCITVSIWGLVGWYAWYLGLKSGNSKVRCSNPGVTEFFLNFLLTFTQRKAQICALGLNLILGYFVYICQVTTVRERERKRKRERERERLLQPRAECAHITNYFVRILEV